MTRNIRIKPLKSRKFCGKTPRKGRKATARTSQAATGPAKSPVIPGLSSQYLRANSGLDCLYCVGIGAT